MTVTELIKALQEHPGDAEVIVNNDHGDPSPWEGTCDGTYVASSTWTGDFIDAEDPDCDDEDGVPAVFIYGVN